MLSRGARLARGLTGLALGLSCGLVGCSSDHAGQQGQDPPAATEKAPTPVQVSEAVPVADEESYPSDLYVERDVWVTPRATGIIEQVPVERGQRVRQGQPLVVLETDLQDVEMKVAEQTLRYHQAAYDRSRLLHEDKIVSAIDALRDEIQRDLSASELERARALLERCTMRAPFDGVVVERLAVPGQRVIEDDATNLVRVVADDRQRARIHVPEQRLGDIAVGREVSIELAGATSAKAHPGRVVFISPAVDAASDTALVIVEADRRDPSLRVGAGVEIRLAGHTEVAHDLFRVPRQALGGGRLVEGAKATLLVAEDGRAAERRVDLVELSGADVTVRGALDQGDLVIVAGGTRLAAGDPVEVRSRKP